MFFASYRVSSSAVRRHSTQTADADGRASSHPSLLPLPTTMTVSRSRLRRPLPMTRLLPLTMGLLLLHATAVLLVSIPLASAWAPSNPWQVGISSRLALTRSYGRLGVTNTLDMEASSTSLSSVGLVVNGDSHELGQDAIVEIENEQHHQEFLQTHKDKLVVMKVRHSEQEHKRDLVSEREKDQEQDRENRGSRSH